MIPKVNAPTHKYKSGKKTQSYTTKIKKLISANSFQIIFLETAHAMAIWIESQYRHLINFLIIFGK